jgi:PhnB protein
VAQINPALAAEVFVLVLTRALQLVMADESRAVTISLSGRLAMSQASKSADDPKTSIAPMLSVRRGAEAVQFYKAAFDATELFLLENDGSVVAQLSVGGAEFWVADESPQHLNFSPESLGGATTRMVMVVDDPDATFNRAVAAGAKVVMPVENQPYGWRVGRILDPFGHHWEIGKPLAAA